MRLITWLPMVFVHPVSCSIFIKYDNNSLVQSLLSKNYKVTLKFGDKKSPSTQKGGSCGSNS